MAAHVKKDNQNDKIRMPGSLVLALIFLLFFAVMFLVNYDLLGKAWPIK